MPLKELKKKVRILCVNHGFFAQYAVVKAHVAFFSKVRQAKQQENMENAAALTVQVWECPYETKG